MDSETIDAIETIYYELDRVLDDPTNQYYKHSKDWEQLVYVVQAKYANADGTGSTLITAVFTDAHTAATKTVNDLVSGALSGGLQLTNLNINKGFRGVEICVGDEPVWRTKIQAYPLDEIKIYKSEE
ncbi:MAG: hypothetical protein ACYSR0_04290 [Planctomycetota bacterium]|jgi:hypothetical protein